ncbi:MAG TPA: hypothetical protein VN612_05950 [Acidobacteriaceae bacterium]|nr:hypothetical protein [Acidobacteriaceae bacterium]
MQRAGNIVVLLALAAMCAWHTAAQSSVDVSRGDTRWEAPAADLAKQITGIAGPGPATLNVQNVSSLTPDQVVRIRRLLETDLRTGGIGVRVGAEGAAIPMAIRITLSQTARRGVWIAEVQQGAETRVAMTELAFDVTMTPNSAPAAMTLRRQMLFTSPEPVLDAQVAPDGTLLALMQNRIALYRQSSGQWQQVQSYAISPALAPTARDPRGEIVPGPDSVRVFLPGVECETVAEREFDCHASDDPWPIGTQKAFYNASRDFFSGVLVPAAAATPPPFYSAAETLQMGGTVTLLADLHGHVRMVDRGAIVEVTGSRDWGSDLAGLRTGCGAGSQILVDTAGDPAHDSLRAYEIRGHEAAAVSAAIPFDGSITALHSTSDGGTAMAVAHNGNTYEVWRVSLDCR